MSPKSEGSEQNDNPKPAGESPPPTLESANTGKSKAGERKTDPASKSTRNRIDSLKIRLKELDLNQRLTLLLSITAILLTIFTTVREIRRESRQEELRVTQEAMQGIQSTQEAARATFEAESQMRNEAITEAQNNLQATQIVIAQIQLNLEQDQQNLVSTQTVYQAALISLYSQLAYPYVEVIQTPEPFLISELQFESLESDMRGKDELVGSINLLLANNGGGQTSLISVDLIQENMQENGLQWELQKTLPSPNTNQLFPLSIPGQTAFNVTFVFSSQLPDPAYLEKPGIVVIDDLEEMLSKSTAHLQLEFSNAEPLEIPIDLEFDPSLLIQETYLPTVIPITQLDTPSQICFEIIGDRAEIEAIFYYQGKNLYVQSGYEFLFSQTVSDRDCWWLPAGYYFLTYASKGLPSWNGLEFIAQPYQSQLIKLGSPFLGSPIESTPTPSPPSPSPPPSAWDRPTSIGDLFYIVVILLVGVLLVVGVRLVFLLVLRIVSLLLSRNCYLGIVSLDSEGVEHHPLTLQPIGLKRIGWKRLTRRIVISGNKENSHIFVPELRKTSIVVKFHWNEVQISQGYYYESPTRLRKSQKRGVIIKTHLSNTVLLFAIDLDTFLELKRDLQKKDQHQVLTF